MSVTCTEDSSTIKTLLSKASLGPRSNSKWFESPHGECSWDRGWTETKEHSFSSEHCKMQVLSRFQDYAQRLTIPTHLSLSSRIAIITSVVGVVGFIWFRRRASRPQPARYIENNLIDFPSNISSLSDVLTPEVNETLKHYLQNYLNEISEKYTPEDTHVKGDATRWTLYTGPLGISYMYLRLYETTQDDTQKKSYLDLACKYLKEGERLLDHAQISDIFVSVYGGYTSLYAIGAVVHHYNNQHETSEIYLNKFTEVTHKIAEGFFPCSDCLWGVAAHLNGIKFLNTSLGREVVDAKVTEKIISQLIEAGHSDSKALKVPQKCALAWKPLTAKILTAFLVTQKFGKKLSWVASALSFVAVKLMINKLCMVGMGHGIMGHINSLLLFPEILSAHEDWQRDIKETAEFLTEAVDNSTGNSLMVLSKPVNDLVHWCHGAPGGAMFYARAYEIYGDPQLLQAAEKFGEITWQHGLLKKGNGICHGVAGNGYCLLSLYKVTKNLKWLFRAVQFAKFTQSPTAKENQRTPDNPYSLYEGMAGTVLFYNDLLHNPSSCKFPLIQF